MKAVEVRRKERRTTAIQWNGANLDAVHAFAGVEFHIIGNSTLHSGFVYVQIGGWIIRHVGLEGKEPLARTWYTVDGGTFAELYEVVA